MKPLLFTLLLAPALQASASDIVAISTFDSGLDGWTPSGRTCILSNPGGFLRAQDLDGGWSRPVAPEKFAGDWRRVGRISFDIRPDAGRALQYPAAVRVMNANGEFSEFEFEESATPIGVWSTLSVRIGPGEGNWDIPASIRAAVSEFSIRIDLNDNNLDSGTIELDDLDNITLFAACPADLNSDGQVDDADFLVFLFSYNTLDFASPAMPADCPADFNNDGFVDDADFVTFVTEYNQLLCP